MRRIAAYCIGFAALAFLGAGCTLQSSDSFLKSTDSGSTWSSISIMGTGKQRVRLATVDVSRMSFDPRNSQMIFAGTLGNGLFVSDSGGQNWVQLLPREQVLEVIPDPVSRCTLFVILPTRVLKTTNCAESWSVVLNETRPSVMLRAGGIDPYASNIVYIGTSSGEVFRTLDGGSTWTTIAAFPQRSIARILVAQTEQADIYLATVDGSVFQSKDKAVTWHDLTVTLGSGKRAYQNISLLEENRGLFFATQDSLYRTLDEGRTWDRISMLTPPGQVRIFVTAMNPRDPTDVYYASANTFYHTTDSGGHWTARPLRGGRLPGQLIMDPNDPTVLYLGFRNVKPQGSSPFPIGR